MAAESSIVAGIDIGAATAKAVLLKGNKIISSHVMPTGDSVNKAAEFVMAQVLDKAGVLIKNVRYIVATGYGRRRVTVANEVVTELSCHAKGAHWLIPQAGTVIDIGGQDSKVIEIGKNGSIGNFSMNDKCAAGTGRFLEVMASVLNVDIADIGSISLDGSDPCQISNTCTVFAESEMVTLRADGESRENILAGMHSAMAHRISIMGKSVGFRDLVIFTGGVARNIGMKQALEARIGKEILVPENPQIIGALGAAVIARERCLG
jgi:(R)-2-hydroxyacyl-CoA dehydratese activating ATPase